MDFKELKGKTLRNVHQIGDDRIRFEADDGKVYELYHSQDCCESVVVESITGDLADLCDTPILLAEEVTSNDDPADVVERKVAMRAKDEYVYDDESQTWTFYKLRTIKGSIDIRWHGSSNGYYSESVDFAEVR